MVISLTVNPEARVYARIEQHAVHQATVGLPLLLPVSVFNTGFVTARIVAQLAGSVTAPVDIQWEHRPLSGAQEEHRVMSITPHVPGLADVTITFGFESEPPDLGGRDRISLLIRSGAPTAPDHEQIGHRWTT